VFTINSFCQQSGWKKFNHKYGFTIQLPNHFKEATLTASGIQYYESDAIGDDVMIMVETFGSKGNETERLFDNYNSALKDNKNITYKHLEKDHFVVSGYDDTGIYYIRYIENKEYNFFLRIQYSRQNKIAMDELVPKIARSFRTYN